MPEKKFTYLFGRLAKAITQVVFTAALTVATTAAPSSGQPTTESKPCDPAWVDIRTYGARPNDTTDDRWAIQRAVDIAAANSGIVCIPNGTFLLSSQAEPDPGFTNPQAVLLWLRSGVSIVGTGPNSILKVGDHMNDHDTSDIPHQATP